ncbi:MAG TPA: hypothetical protein VJ984_00785 [Xanthomonadales bacterium]|nr:hypothetical protein [Xanthomonadales bacterium]
MKIETGKNAGSEARKMKRTADRNNLDFRIIEILCFALLLPIATIARLVGWRWQPWKPGPDGYGPVLDEAKSMAQTIAGMSPSA